MPLNRLYDANAKHNIYKVDADNCMYVYILYIGETVKQLSAFILL